MKLARKSISFVPSETVAQHLEELGRIVQMTPQAIIEDIATFELENMFGSTDDSADVDASTHSLQRYLYRHNYSREQASTVAAAYNAFVVRHAQHTGRPAELGPMGWQCSPNKPELRGEVSASYATT